LTHTLEVASIARTIARALRLNEDLVEALALAHDLGHPPFGHAGEDVLDECLRDVGGFNHNSQGLRICEVLETSYRQSPGLNLTQEVLDGQRQRAEMRQRKATSGMVADTPSPLLEVQVVDAADSIAYDAHDADDSLELELLDAAQLLDVPLWDEARARIVSRFPTLGERRLRRAIVHEVIDWQVSDLVEHSAQLLSQNKVDTIHSVRRSRILISSSPGIGQKKSNLERFLFDKVYRHPRLLAEREPAQRSLREMYFRLISQPEILPAKFRRLAERDGLPRAVGDYLAGMTDRFALDEHRRLMGS
ncbi:MAG TPA: HD domain-containing protein, partial [Lacipirellulaceae bacterium]|nr:HD domain-containing protein [Lacipirellulaceae bacterium]